MEPRTFFTFLIMPLFLLVSIAFILAVNIVNPKIRGSYNF